jgi:hypothetical protein
VKTHGERLDLADRTQKCPDLDGYVLSRGRIVVPREKLLGNIASVLGNDRYVRDRK